MKHAASSTVKSVLSCPPVSPGTVLTRSPRQGCVRGTRRTAQHRHPRAQGLTAVASKEHLRAD